MEASFVFVVSGIPSRARWLGEPGALVGTAMLLRHSRAGQGWAGNCTVPDWGEARWVLSGLCLYFKAVSS